MSRRTLILPILCAAAILLASAITSPVAAAPRGAKKPDARPEPEKLEDGRIVLRGTREVLADPPTGSYCADAATEITGEVTVGGLTITPKKDDAIVEGAFNKSPASFKAGPYSPHDVKKKGVLKDHKVTLKAAELAKGVDLELADADGGGLAMIRLERTWRGLTWAPLSGYAFALDGDVLHVVDADLDGRVSTGDRMLYGDNHLWMPFHTFTACGAMIYRKIEPHDVAALACRAEAADPAGDDAEVLDKWNAVRKQYGVPPGAYEKEWSANCVKHAEYLLRNNARGHGEDPNLPGYSVEGEQAGNESCLSAMNKNSVLGIFMKTAYHRDPMIDPRNCYLQLGGNQRAYLMAGATRSTKPQETRATPQYLRYPASETSVPFGAWIQEQPEPLACKLTKNVGLPIMVSLFTYQPADLANVDCKLYRVAGNLRAGKRDKPVANQVSYRDHNAPEDDANNFGLILLTPLEVLKDGVYEADFKFDYSGATHHYTWRFSVGVQK